MYLRKHDLLQIDDEWLKWLPAERLLQVSKRLLYDVKELPDRLNQNPENRSRSPTRQAAWAKPEKVESGNVLPDENFPGESETEVAAAEATEATEGVEDTAQAPVKPSTAAKASRTTDGKAGWQSGSRGYGRSQKFAATGTRDHSPEHCAACVEALAADARLRADTAWDEINLAPSVDAIQTARIDLLPKGLPCRDAAHVYRLKRLCHTHRYDDHSGLRPGSLHAKSATAGAFRSPSQRHRNLPSSRRFLMALSRQDDPGSSQGLATSRASSPSGSSVKAGRV